MAWSLPTVLGTEYFRLRGSNQLCTKVPGWAEMLPGQPRFQGAKAPLPSGGQNFRGTQRTLGTCSVLSLSHTGAHFIQGLLSPLTGENLFMALSINPNPNRGRQGPSLPPLLHPDPATLVFSLDPRVLPVHLPVRILGNALEQSSPG